MDNPREDREGLYKREIEGLQARLAKYERRDRGFYLCIARLLGYGLLVWLVWPKAQALFNSNSDLGFAGGALLNGVLGIMGIVIACYTGLDLITRFSSNSSDNSNQKGS